MMVARTNACAVSDPGARLLRRARLRMRRRYFFHLHRHGNSAFSATRSPCIACVVIRAWTSRRSSYLYLFLSWKIIVCVTCVRGVRLDDKESLASDMCWSVASRWTAHATPIYRVNEERTPTTTLFEPPGAEDVNTDTSGYTMHDRRKVNDSE